MQILALNLNNTKSYRNARLTFGEGVNAIVGHNGAGKSTILEAIGFVLFDALEYRHDDFVREGADSAEILVEFRSALDERSYQVIRRVGSSTQYRIFDSEFQLKICEGKADVQRFLRQHMGVDAGSDLAALFRDAVGVPQGTFTAIFLEAPGKRKPTFDRLLQVEEYSRASDRLREPARLLREGRQELDVRISALSARLERLPPLEQAVTARTGAITAATTEVAHTDRQLTELSARRSVLDQIQQQVSTLRNRHIQLVAQVDALAVQQEGARSALEQAEAARATVADHQPGHDRYLAAQARQQELDQQLRQRQQVERRQAELERSLVQSQTALATLDRDLQLIAEAEALVVQLAPAVAEQEQLEAALAQAQQEQARLEDARHQVAAQAAQVDRLQRRQADLERQLAQLATLTQQSQQFDEQITSARLAIDTAREQEIASKNAADLIKRQNDALADVTTARCPVCEQPLAEEQRTTMLNRNAERLTALRAEYKAAHDALRAAETTLKSHEAERQQLQQQLMRLPRADERERAEQELAQANTALATAQQRVESLAAAPAAAEQLRAQLTQLADPRSRHAVAAATAARRVPLEAEQGRLQEQLTAQQDQISEHQAELARFADLDATLDHVRAELHQHEAAYQMVLTNRQLAATVERRAADVERLVALYQLAQEEARHVESDLRTAESQFDQTEYQQVLGQEQQTRSHLTQLQTELRLLEQQQDVDQKEIATLRTQKEELCALETQKARIGKQEEVLDALRDLLRRAGPQVTRALIQQVSHSANQIFGEMMQDYTRQLTWNEDYGIALEVEGRQRQFAQLSGGEQMCAALAVRLALLREMSNIDIAFFDEPTTNLDETRRDSLVRQILDIRGFRQLFVISHDDAFEQATQNLIRVQRVNGASVIVARD
jgi:DNA repair protein SbcC/Rad50